MYTEDQLRGMLNTPDRQLLFEIRNLLKEQNELLKSILENENKQGNGIVPDQDKNAVETKIESQKHQRRRNK